MKKTNWHVITGAPCSGKTAVILELERRGYAVVQEVARAYIDAEINKGKDLRQIKADLPAFEGHILKTKARIESGLDPDAVVFLDRAVPDSVAYFQLAGLDPAEPFEHSRAICYKQIFLFERIQFKTDAVRSEDDRIAADLDRLLEAAYRKLGYHPIRVPLMPVDERADYILSKI
ncbi:MAG: ATP-binding protein [Desulfobacterales bacterium]|nr:ATP-binding protein [Desulfobacterales bacterium]